MMSTCRIGLALALLASGSLSASDWPHWRGPFATGISDDTNAPERWSASENVAWRSDLGGVGVSSPIVAAGRVFVTSQAGAGVSRRGPRLAQGAAAAGSGERELGVARAGADVGEGVVFLVEAFDRTSGDRLWHYRLPAAGPLPTVHDKHNLASPSPVSDGERVYAWFGTGQIVALDMDGRLVWERHLGEEIAPFDINWGHGSSPALHDGLLILLCDHPAAAYLLAVDKRTGEDRWMVDRGTGRSSYSTPFVVDTASGAEVVVNSSERVDAYDAETGAFLWHVGESNSYPIPVPTFHEGTMYLSRGYRSGPYMAVRPGGRGDVSESHVVWRVPTGAPYISSLVYDGGLLYMASDVGVITAIDARTGARVWQERVDGLFTASPVAADGKIYFVSETGEVIVVRSGTEPEIIARNDIGERLMASLAVSDGQIFLRSDDRVFCIGTS